ncbi:hypothetical protein ACXZ1M_10770 [Duganella sp. PWIR1]
MDISTVLSSTVMAGLVAAAVSLHSSERKIHMENITHERAIWRGEMRKLADALTKAARDANANEVELHCIQLMLNLNPFDTEDMSIVAVAKGLVDSTDLDAALNELTERMALLLKHDWERAKREARPWFFRRSEPKRTLYAEYKCTAKTATSITKKQPGGSLTMHFSGLTVSAGIMFFMVVGLKKPFSDLMMMFNDQDANKTLIQWFAFALISLFFGSLWSGTYLWFKASEKRFLEIFLSK